MDDRETTLARIKTALNSLPERTAYPEWDSSLAVSHHALEENSLELFKRRFVASKGLFFEDADALFEYIESEGLTHGYVQTEVLPYVGKALRSCTHESEMNRDRIDSYAFGITKASGAIAESGTLILRDADCPYRLGALAPWIHVAVLDRSAIVHTIVESIADLGDDPSIVFVTGPSKTADIEGILIQGVHGPGIQAVLVV